jgi:TP901 family phage tail tape measure protein
MAFSALIGALRVALRLDQAEYVEGLKQSKAELKKAAGDLNRIARDMSRSGRDLTLGITAPMAAAAVASIKMAADFESSMIKVKISTKATAGEMTALEAEARKIGKATIFSASEAADAMDMLAKTGLSATQILGGAAKAAVNLAAAAGSELEPAASAISDAMQQFGLTAAQLPGVVDQITGAVNESKLSFEDFTNASGQAGGVAASLGVKFEDFNAVLAGTSSLFSSGSDAGTSFKTFLTTLVPKSTEAASAIEQFGLKFFKADGSLRSMSEIAEELRTKLAGLSDEAKNQVLKDIFGTDAMRTAIGLMNQGAEGLDRIKKAIAETDAAAQAPERMKGFTGQLEQLKGSIEELAIAIGDTGILAGATQLVKGLTGVIDAVSELDPMVLKLGLGFAAALAAVGPLNLAMGALAGAGASALRAIVALSAGAGGLRVAMVGLAGFLGPGGLMVLGIGAVAAVMLLMAQRTAQLSTASKEATDQSNLLNTATAAYATAASQAATASGEARAKFLQEAAAKRELALQTIASAKAKLADARATLAQIRSENARAIEGDRFNTRGDAAGTIKPILNNDRALRARADLKERTEALEKAEKDLADADKVLAAGQGRVAAASAKVNVAIDKEGESARRAKKEIDDLARAHEQLKDDAEGLLQSLETDAERVVREYAEATILLKRALDAGIISVDQYREAIERLNPVIVDVKDAQKAANVEFEKTPASLAEGVEAIDDSVESALEDFLRMRGGWDDVFDDIRNKDWASAFRGLLEALKDVRKAFSETGTTADKVTAISSLADAAGRAIGGKGGRALSSAANAGTTAFLVTGNPIVAAAAAAVAGLAELLKSKPSNKGAGFSLVTGQFTGDKRTPETERAVKTAADAITKGQELLEAAGLKLGATVHGLVIGTRDLSQIYLTNGRTVTAAVGDAAAAAEAGLRAMLETATFTDETQRKLVEGMLAANKGFDEVAAALERLAGARGLKQAIGDAILELTDPDALALSQLERAQQARRKEIEAAFKAGLLSDEEIADLRTQLTRLEGLEIADLLENIGDGVEGLAARQRDLAREYYAAIGDTAAALRLLREQELAETPEALRGLRTALYGVQDAVAAREAAEERAAQAREDALRQAEEETRLYEGMRDRFQALADGIAAVRKELTGGPLGGLNLRQQAAVSAGELARLTTRARTGDEAALAALPDAIRRFVEAQGAVAGNRTALNAQLALARRAASVGEKAALNQVSDAQKQLNALQLQTAQLTEVKVATVSMAERLTAYTNAQFELQSTQARVAQATYEFMAALPGQLQDFASNIAAAVSQAPPPDLTPVNAATITAAVGAANDSHSNDNASQAEQYAQAVGAVIAPMAAATIKTANILDDTTRGGNALYTTAEEP